MPADPTLSSLFSAGRREPASMAVRPVSSLPRRRPSALNPLFGRDQFVSGPPAVPGPPDPAAFLLALGKRVRLLRLTHELTQDELAQAAGMSRSFVSLIEHGVHGVDIVRLLRLAAVLGISLSSLVDVAAADV
jgi:DNA-binding XRE family transcriptional regulator